MNYRKFAFPAAWTTASLVVLAAVARTGSPPGQATGRESRLDDAADMFYPGRQVFRFDTSVDQSFWGDSLQFHKAPAL